MLFGESLAAWPWSIIDLETRFVPLNTDIFSFFCRSWLWLWDPQERQIPNHSS